MRPAIVVFILVTAGGLSVAFAEPPVAPAPGSRTTAAPTSPAATPAAANVAANQAPKAVDERAEEKTLRLQGYKPQMMSGEMVYCRREIPLGSHLPTTLKCISAAQAKMMAQEGRQTTERIQRNQTACLSTATLRGPATGPANCGN